MKDKVIIGIQGDHGSTNERAAYFFAERHDIKEFEIKYLISTENVLKALNNNEIDYGTFAWQSSRGGLVVETQEAIQKYDYVRIDDHKFQLDHAILMKDSIDPEEMVYIYTHPQALKEHIPSFKEFFNMCEGRPEIDTAIAAKNLKEGIYPKNSVVIAPITCTDIYDLDIYKSSLPTNEGYFTDIFFVKKQER